MNEELESYKVKFKQFLETTPTGVAVIENREIIEINSRLRNLLGYSLNEIQELGVKNIFPFLSDDKIFNCLDDENKLLGKLGFDASIINKTGEELNFIVNYSCYNIDENVSLILIFSDVTVSKNRERDLLKSDNQIRNLFDNLIEGAFYLSNEGLISNINDSALKIFNLKVKEAFNINSLLRNSLIIHENGRPLKFSEFPSHQVFKDGKKMSSEIFGVFNKKKKDYLWIRFNIIPILDENDQVDNLLLTINNLTHLKKSTENLIESEQRYKTVADYTSNWEYWLNSKKKYEYISPVCEEITGYPVSKFYADSSFLFKIIHPEDLKKVRSHYITKFNVESNDLDEFRIINKKGEIRYIKHNCRPVFSKEGDWLGKRGSNIDITHSKKVSLALSESEKKYRLLFTALNDGYSLSKLVFDNNNLPIDYEYLDCNLELLNNLNLDKKDLIGHTVKEIFPNIEKTWLDECFKVGITGMPSKFEFFAEKLNKYFDVSIYSPMRNHISILTRDITDRKVAEKKLNKYNEELEKEVESRTLELNNQNEFLNTLINTIPNPVFVKDKSKKYTKVNDALLNYFNIRSDEIIGHDIRVSDDEKLIKKSNETDDLLLEKHGMEVYETKINSEDGKKYLLIYKASFGPKNSPPIGIAGQMIDITSQKELNKNIEISLKEQRELNAMKNQFISMASHEFRTPLTTILASSDLLNLKLSKFKNENYSEIIERIINSTEEMDHLLQQLIDVSRTDSDAISLHLKEIQIEDYTRKIISNVQHERNRDLIVFDVNLPRKKYKVDEKFLKHIIGNFFSNALKYSDNNSRITINLKEVNNSLSISIQDNGIGIEENELQKIFEPFYRGNKVGNIEGNGLGLMIAKKFAELHKGKINARSSVKEGTVFEFLLPIL